MTQAYKLYGRRGAGSFAVQAALEEVGARYECVWVGREPGDVAQLRKLSQAGKVPVLALPDGSVMFESGAMLIHIALAHPQAGVAPQPGTSAHAAFLQWVVFLSANLYETALRIYYPERYSSAGAGAAAAIRERATADYRDHLALIGARLEPYVLGPRYSLADAYLYMLASWYPGDRDELHRSWPRLGAHAALLASRPSIAKAAADHAE